MQYAFYSNEQKLYTMYILAHVAMHFNWDEEEADKNWKREPMNIRQRIADKCRNLNKKKK